MNQYYLTPFSVKILQFDENRGKLVLFGRISRENSVDLTENWVKTPIFALIEINRLRGSLID